MKITCIPIEGYEYRYQILNNGMILSNYNKQKKFKFLKPWSNGKGYLVITLMKNKERKNYYIHRLVASHFIDNLNNYPEVAHINGKRADNRVENLRWSTHLDNEKDKLIHGTRIRGEKASWSKLNNEKVLFIRKALKNGIQKKILANTFNVTSSALRAIEKGRNWSHIQ